MTEKARDYEVVKRALKEAFQKKSDPQDAFDRDIGLQRRRGEISFSEFFDSADDVYELARFPDEHRFSFLTRSLRHKRLIRSFLVLHNQRVYGELKKKLREYQVSLNRFQSLEAEFTSVVPSRHQDVISKACCHAR